jgi:hypothetical protein
MLKAKEFAELRQYEIPNSISYKLKSAINLLLEFVLEREMKSQAVLGQLR